MNETKDPGLGSKYKHSVKRLINEDGSYNIVRKGSVGGFRDFYKFLIDLSWSQFFLVSTIAYLIFNLLFACLYLAVGVDQINGLDGSQSDFLNAFFVSVQTFTTVGYGFLAPVGAGAGIISTFEAFFGLMYFALITGLLYGRFSRPKSKIAFAKNAIITPFQDGQALMFKMVNQRKSVLTETSVNCIFTIDIGSGENAHNKEYHRVELELDQVNFFPLTWTLVHKISEDSPLAGLSIDELKRRHAELIVLVNAFDETFSQNIVEKQSFAGDQWLDGVKFDRNFHTNSKGQIVLDVKGIDNVSKV